MVELFEGAFIILKNILSFNIVNECAIIIMATEYEVHFLVRSTRYRLYYCITFYLAQFLFNYL